MKKGTVFSLQADNAGLFDGSFHAKALQLSPKVKTSKRTGTVSFKDGAFIEVPRSEQYDELEAFTIETTVTIKHRKTRQNLVEGQSPPIALFVEKGGKLMGSVHTASGWQSVTSGRKNVPLNKKVDIVFSRDEKGRMRLSMNKKGVGTRAARGKLASVGEQGFLVGVGADKRSHQLNGEVAALSIRAGAVDPNELKVRGAKAKQLQQELRRKLGVGRIRVVPDQDESYARLQPIKSILSAVGVDNLTDLTALNVPNNTVITPGKIMLAPKKSTGAPVAVQWGKLAAILKTANASTKKTLLAKHLPNRNSIKTLKKAVGSSRATGPTVTANVLTPRVGRARLPLLGNLGADSRVLRSMPQQPRDLASTARPVERTEAMLASRRFAANRSLGATIDLKSDKLKVKDPNILKNLANAGPSSWPMLSGATMLMASTFQLPIDTSVIIANRLDLRNVELRVEPEVKKLYVIAEEIVVNGNSKITWRRPGGSTPPRAANPDLNGRGYTGQHLKPNSYDGLDGHDGGTGGNGTSGASGRTAPALEIWARAMNGMPNLDLNGDDGIRGGRGQRGGRGGVERTDGLAKGRGFSDGTALKTRATAVMAVTAETGAEAGAEVLGVMVETSRSACSTGRSKRP